jgi:hypothetical protein
MIEQTAARHLRVNAVDDVHDANPPDGDPTTTFPFLVPRSVLRSACSRTLNEERGTRNV